MITRRLVLAAAGAMTANANVPAAKPNTFLLVHGAWHGGWCWRPVQKLLEKAGATVFVPSLTGLGDRRHLLSEKVNLATHVDDVVDLLESEELENVTLVGHSYAGLVVTGAAAKARERLAQVIYLDAFVPNSGQSMLDLMSPKYSDHWRERAKKDGDGWKVPPMLDAKAMGLTGALAARVDKKLSPQPLATVDDKLDFDPKTLEGLKRSYIRAGGYSGFGPTSERVKKDGWTVKSIDCGHDVMLAKPDELAAMLLEG